MPRLTASKTSPQKAKAALSAAEISLINYISSYSPVSREAIKFIKSKLQVITLKKSDLLHKAGLQCPYLFYVAEGVLRGFIMDGKREVTTWITAESGLVTSIRSFILRMPTLENISAIEDCTLLVLRREDIEELYATFPEGNLLGRKIAEVYYTWAESRAFICRLSKATSRYEFFISENGHLVNRIPLTYIASYLNMNLETLSRIRTRLSKKKQA